MGKHVSDILSRNSTGEAPLRDAARACSDMEKRVLEPAPYPMMGERYTIHIRPSALVRREENSESDVIAELRVGGVVTVLDVGEEDTGRAKVYTEHAVRIMMEAFEDGGELISSHKGVPGGVTGWITSAGLDGQHFLRPLAVLSSGEKPPVTLAERLVDLGN